jgi:hypothetical protein
MRLSSPQTAISPVSESSMESTGFRGSTSAAAWARASLRVSSSGAAIRATAWVTKLTVPSARMGKSSRTMWTKFFPGRSAAVRRITFDQSKAGSRRIPLRIPRATGDLTVPATQHPGMG